MDGVNPELLNALRQARVAMAAVDPDDAQTLVPVGVALESCYAELEETPYADALALILQGLQALYEGDFADPPALVSAIQASLGGLTQAVEADDDAIALGAARYLRAALGFPLDEVADDDDDMDFEEATPENLDDVAAMLIALDKDDLPAMVRFKDALAAFVSNEALPEPARLHVKDALAIFDAVLNEAAPDPAVAMLAVNAALEAALVEVETVEMGLRPQAHAEPDAPVPEAPIAPPAEAPAPVSAPEPTAAPIAPNLSTESGLSAESSLSAESLLPADADVDLLGEFITECQELIEGAEAALLGIEVNPGDTEAVNTVFRAFHTIKGTAAFLGIDAISGLAHRAESLLSRARDGEIRLTGGYADLALRSADMLKELLEALKDALAGRSEEIPSHLGALMAVLADPDAAGAGEALAPVSGAAAIPKANAAIRASANGTSPAAPSPVASSPLREATSAPDSPEARGPQRPKSSDAEETSVRVRTDRLDQLIEMVGELVIAQSMVAQDPGVLSGHQHELTRKVAHAGKIVRELQALSMSMRMVPLKPTFQKMARLVRDLAQKSGKQVEFITEGDDTEIDRNMVDVVRDPLVHMVRNAVDHGIESPQVRVEAGKPAQGRVVLRAFHAGENVVVEIRDDGKGLDRERIVAKAVSRGILDADRSLSDAEVYDLIFAPGFSTADQVTDISGRGVGMDVVRKSVEALRGRVEIASEAGHGSTFSLRLPLTLAITDGMLVRIGEERYIIPTVNIYLSFRPELSALSTVAGRGELVMLRGELMPVFRLHRLFDIENAVEDPTRGLLVVIGDEGRRCALLVDELLGQQQVVAKALGEGVGKVQGVSGGAILGDGRVGLILDTTQIATLARQSPSGLSARIASSQPVLAAA